MEIWMPNILMDITIILLLIILNGIFAMSEIAIVSSRKTRLQQMVNEGNVSARTALDLANSPGEFLSTIQIGITLVGIFAGAYGGTTIAIELSGYLKNIQMISPYSEVISVASVVIIITFLTIVIGELVPKRIALNNAEKISAIIAPPMNLLSKLAMPAVMLLSISTEFILRLLRVRPPVEPPVTEEEIKILIDQGTRVGVVEAAERDIIESIFRFGDRRVSMMMVPRNDVVALYTDDTVEEIRQKIVESDHSSYPVCEDTLDNVIGVVFTKDLLTKYMEGRALDLKSSIRDALFIPEGTSALNTLELFKKSGKHMGLIIDEYGGMQGLITVHDILEAVVGEISEIESPKVIPRGDGSWLVDGMTPIDEFMSIFRFTELPGEEEGVFQTVGGFVMMYLNRVPVVGDNFTLNGFKFEVRDMDGLRVDKILLIPLPKQDEKEPDKQ